MQHAAGIADGHGTARSLHWGILFRNFQSVAAVLALIFLSAMSAAAALNAVPTGLAAAYAAASACTFILYGIDKSAARAGRPRTPEKALHLLALSGGWPGALLAQAAFRHKTRKQPFVAILWLTAIINCGGFALLLAGWRGD